MISASMRRITIHWRECNSGVCVADLPFLPFFFSRRRRHPRYWRDWSSDVCSSDLNLTASAELTRLNPPPKPQPPAWRIVAPAPASELLGHYRAAEAAVGVPWQYLAAIHLVETRMGRIRGVSVAGAQGPMQFLPSTWET